MGERAVKLWVGEPGRLSPEERERFREERLRLVCSRLDCLVIFLKSELRFRLKSRRQNAKVKSLNIYIYISLSIYIYIDIYIYTVYIFSFFKKKTKPRCTSAASLTLPWLRSSGCAGPSCIYSWTCGQDPLLWKCSQMALL